jgi:malonyl-CoA/methylmalonyl-CoA synthetase
VTVSSGNPPWAAHLPPGMQPDDVDLLADGSLMACILRRWSERSSARQLQGEDGEWLSACELEALTRDAAQRLHGAGLERGDRFMLSGPTSVDLVIAYLGALRAGLVVVPVNPAYTMTEVTRIVRDARPTAAAVAAPELAGWIRQASEEPVRLLEPELALPAVDGGEIDTVGTDDPALLIYTSGTTGRPKGALLSHGNLLASAGAVNLAWRWTPEDRLLLTLPLFHVHGLGVGLNGSLCAGAEIVLRPKFDPADVAERCREGCVSLFFGVPTMYQRLVESESIGELAGLRLLVSGSAPLAAALAERIADRAGQLPLERYGMTETVMLTSNPCDGERKPGTVGFALPGVELRLDPDKEVQVRGPNVISGYYQRPEATAEAYIDDGWFRTGDLGEFDSDGYLTLVGRSKELIISGGYNVYPREVEEALVTHPDVREVAVIGRPSERWGEEVTAVVVAERAVDEETLRAYAAEALAPYKVPKRIEFADELPRNAMGKLVRGEL